ncbi:MAG: purine nucleoside phosphorylase I, inosine and guanosine-specific [bacterium]|nr:purine nucleoside phosphorylase I, inosine and guanosine-specific [bacterium]
MFDKDKYLIELGEASEYLLKQGLTDIKVAIILGSGLNEIAESFEEIRIINYSDVPNFLRTTVEGHKGRLVLCKYKGSNILFMQGRFHYYEGYPMYRVVFPLRVLSLMGVKNLVVTNASGGINPDFRVGDVMIINDHIAFFVVENPLRGPNLEGFGPRFPSMQNAYDKEWIEKIKRKIRNFDGIREGVYCMVTGPNYETPAELRMLKILGVDAVGMSTVPEVIVAKHCGIKVVGFSVITDIAEHVVKFGVTHDEVLENTKKSVNILKELINIAIDTIDE